jgi:hypothetical protein
MQILKAGTLYFALVFGAGFVMGTIRTLWVVPSVGMRKSELMEEPLMLVIMFLAARWVVRRLRLPHSAPTRLGMGFVGLGLLAAAEIGFVLWLRGMTIREYVASRDPVAGTVYLGMLGVFAVMPLLAAGGRVGDGNVAAKDGSKNTTG